MEGAIGPDVRVLVGSGSACGLKADISDPSHRENMPHEELGFNRTSPS